MLENYYCLLYVFETREIYSEKFIKLLRNVYSGKETVELLIELYSDLYVSKESQNIIIIL